MDSSTEFESLKLSSSSFPVSHTFLTTIIPVCCQRINSRWDTMSSFYVRITFKLFMWGMRNLRFLTLFPGYLLFISNCNLIVKCASASPDGSGSSWARRDFCVLKHLLLILDTFWSWLEIQKRGVESLHETTLVVF